MAKDSLIRGLVLCLLCCLPVYTSLADDGYCVRVTAASYVGVKEKGGNNMGFNSPPFTALMIESGWKKGHAWCAYFVHAMLNECGIVNTITGWSPTAYNRKDVIFDGGKFLKSFNDGDVLVMTLAYSSLKGRYKSIGHTGIVDKIGKYSVRTIEGNTNEQGMRDSRTRDGVYYKIRPLSKNIHITRWKRQE
jgi:hypothetical protein